MHTVGMWSRFFPIGILTLLLIPNSLSMSIAGQAETPMVILKAGTPVLELPESLAALIVAKFPGLRIPTVDDMTGAWAAFSKREAVPYACLGDFNGDGLNDVALILIGKDSWKNVAFHRTSGDGWESLKLGKFAGRDKEFTRQNPPQEFRLYTLKAGEKLKIGARIVERSKYKFDSIAFYGLGTRDSLIHYKWNAKHNLYVATVYHL